jgi:hypothetical protein
VPDKIAGGSSGFANMSRATLQNAAQYIESKYKRPVLPQDISERLLGLNVDSRIPGADWQADLYYAAAHLRELVDRIKKQERYYGPLSLDDIERIAAAYNGSGPMAQKYGRDAIELLKRAYQGNDILYFYQK